MTQIEYIDQMAKLEQEGREMKRAHDTQMQIIEARHRENVNNENDRYNNEKRRQSAEYHTRLDDLNARKTDVKKLRAVTRAEEEAAMAKAEN